MFCMKILLILPKLHEKTLSRSGDIKLFPSRKEDDSPRHYRQSLKWRKTINEMGWDIPGGNFLGGNFQGGDFPGGV